jgi:phage terminase large subunit-like protein
MCSKILSGQSKLEHYFVMINELDKNEAGVLVDNIKDQDCWIKANPIFCSNQHGLETMRMEMLESVEQPEKMTEFLTKRMNVWVHQPESYYLNMDKWALCKGEILDPIKARVFIGIDLAAKIDLTSVGIEYEIDDKYYVLSHSFMPEETLDSRRKRDKAPYDLWVRDGFITITPGSAVEYKTVVEWLINAITINAWAVEEIGIDPWGKQSVESALTEAGYRVVDVIQGIKTLSEPTKNFRELVYQGKVVHDGNPVLTWAIGNACARNMDHNENIMLDKNRSRGRIDPIAALMNAHTRFLSNKFGTKEYVSKGRVWVA